MCFLPEMTEDGHLLEEVIQEIFTFVHTLRGVDFRAYRNVSIRRRLTARINALGLADHCSYLDYLRTNPAEVDPLLDTLTIKVSRFFRNPLTFEILAETVLPEMLLKAGNQPVRIWSAGCARGEEPFSVAMLCRDFLDKEERVALPLILATDVHRESLARATVAVYPPEVLTETRKRHLDRYFAPAGDNYRLSDEIRKMVTFAYHDIGCGVLPQEGMFADYHLILCRNVLIYLDIPLQTAIMTKLAGCLPVGGYLVLGEAESVIPSLKEQFQEILPGSKVFRKEGK